MSINHSLVKGYLDGIEGDELVGWFYCPGSTDALLTLLINGEVSDEQEKFICEVERADLAAETGHPGACGFRVQLLGLARDKVHTLSVVHEDTGYDFHAEKLSYCPAVAEQAPLLREVFLPEYYRYRYHHERLSNEEAFTHYLQFGIYADLDPNPWTDSAYIRHHHADLIEDYDIPILGYLALEEKQEIKPSRLFDPEFYRLENPDIRDEASSLVHFLKHGHLEGRKHRKLVLNPSVKREIDVLSSFEPDLRHVGSNIDTIVRYPQIRAETYIPRLIKRRFPNRPKAVVCVPFLSHGGADLIATFVLTALEKRFGIDNVLMIVTDRCEHTVSAWTDANSNILFLDESERVYGLANRVDLLHAVIGCLAPEIVVNANSHAAWGMYVHYGKQLSRSINLNAYLFCFDYNKNGTVGGYIRDYLPRALPHLHRCFCDNATIIHEIRTMFGFADKQLQKFHNIYVPVPHGVIPLPTDNFAKNDKPVLWIGRLARQKRPELLLDIAARMRKQQFVVYGPGGDSMVAERIMSDEVENIRYMGVYDRLEDLDLDQYSMLLNTSAWEGLPTLLIQILATGLPVVTSRAGGISELVDESTGWLVPDDHDAESYITQMRQVFIHRDVSLARAASGIERVAKRHSWNAFMDRLDKAHCFATLSDQAKPRLIEIPRLLAS